MRVPIVIFFLFLYCNATLSAQDVIDVKYDVDDLGHYKFYCDNNDFCIYSIEVNIISLVNLRGNVAFPFFTQVYPGRNNLFELSPVNQEGITSCNYSYRAVKGCINPKVNADFIYLLPVQPGKTMEVFELKYLKINYKDLEPKNWYTVGLKTNQGDTIYAARRGVVTEVRDTAKLKHYDYVYTSEDNFIEICHADCSFGRYDILSKIFVNLGQEVEAGDPIGLSGGEKYFNGSQVRFSVFYNYKQNPRSKDDGGIDRFLFWAYIPMIFYIGSGKSEKLIYGQSYTCEHPDYIIKKEMTRRQIKKWEKK